MAESKYPSVFVVDREAAAGGPPPPPLPPRFWEQRRRRRGCGGAAQVLLFMLVGVALCGLIIQACFIYRLFQNKNDAASSSTTVSKLVSDKSHSAPPRSGRPLQPSKPVAHLTDGADVIHERQVMGWSMDAVALLYQMDYRRRSLLVQQEGYYYIYSKVSFRDTGVFHHSVQRQTDWYAGDSITLLRTRKYGAPPDQHQHQHQVRQASSFLGGVFHLYGGDAIFVNVSDTGRLVRGMAYENVFGAYMI